MAITGEIIQLSSIALHPLAELERQRVVAVKGEEAHRRSFPDYDWQRLSLVMARISRGQACLEIGPGRAFLSNMIARSERFSRQVAVDVVPRAKRMRSTVEFHEMSVSELTFPDKSFECVICTEVLEHLQDGQLADALLHLRRVCSGRLLVSVPYLEPIPLSKYHVQRFDEARIKEFFPAAKLSVLLKEPVNRVPWILIEERLGAR